MKKDVDILGAHLRSLRHSSRGAIDGAVGELFRNGTAAPLKKFRQFTADLLVFLARLLPVRIEMPEQLFEGGLRDDPVFLQYWTIIHQRHSPSRVKAAQ